MNLAPDLQLDSDLVRIFMIDCSRNTAAGYTLSSLYVFNHYLFSQQLSNPDWAGGLLSLYLFDWEARCAWSHERLGLVNSLDFLGLTYDRGCHFHDAIASVILSLRIPNHLNNKVKFITCSRALDDGSILWNALSLAQLEESKRQLGWEFLHSTPLSDQVFIHSGLMNYLPSGTVLSAILLSRDETSCFVAASSAAAAICRAAAAKLYPAEAAAATAAAMETANAIDAAESAAAAIGAASSSRSTLFPSPLPAPNSTPSSPTKAQAVYGDFAENIFRRPTPTPATPEPPGNDVAAAADIDVCGLVSSSFFSHDYLSGSISTRQASQQTTQTAASSSTTFDSTRTSSATPDRYQTPPRRASGASYFSSFDVSNGSSPSRGIPTQQRYISPSDDLAEFISTLTPSPPPCPPHAADNETLPHSSSSNDLTAPAPPVLPPCFTVSKNQEAQNLKYLRPPRVSATRRHQKARNQTTSLSPAAGPSSQSIPTNYQQIDLCPCCLATDQRTIGALSVESSADQFAQNARPPGASSSGQLADTKTAHATSRTQESPQNSHAAPSIAVYQSFNTQSSNPTNSVIEAYTMVQSRKAARKARHAAACK